MPDAPDTPPDPIATVDRCAEVSALLEDPFADRAAVLHGAGLDENTWAAAQARWVERLVAPDAEPLVARFGEVYETTLRRLTSGGAPVAPASDLDRDDPGAAPPRSAPPRWLRRRLSLPYRRRCRHRPRSTPSRAPRRSDPGARLDEALPFAAPPAAASPARP